MDPNDQNSNPYEFIVNPQQAPKKRGLGLPGIKDPFFARIALIFAGVVVLLIIIGVGLSLLFRGNSVDTQALVGLAQTQQEVIRLASQGTQRSAVPAIRNLAVTTQLSVDSNRLQLIDYLKQNGRKVSTKELGAKRNTAADTQLAAAIKTSTFDSAYVQVMQESLVSYNTELEERLSHAVGKKEKELLTKAAEAAALLLKQVPSIESVQPGV